MASNISKRCLGVHYSQLTARATDSSWIFSGARATCGRNAFRPYATAVKQRPQSTAKGSARGPALNPGSTPKQLTKRAAKASQGAATSITQVNNAAAESQVSSRIPATSTSTASTVVKTSSALRSSSKRGAVPVKSEEAIEDREMTEEEQMAQVDQIMNMSRIFPTADPWGQRVDTLDVHIPYSVSPAHRSRYPTWRAMFDQFMQNRYNQAKNSASMLMLAHANGIHGVDVSEAKWYHKFTQWMWRSLQTQSSKPGTWSAPFRAAALDGYKKLNIALANQDGKTIRQLTTAAHQEHVLRLLKKSQNPNRTFIWRFHREVTPTRVLSIRATEGYLGIEEPKIGNRFMVHALVKFDTEQSLEIYDKRGRVLHTPASGRTVSGDGIVPAERRRVTEYLVLEKRMWYDGPWTFREQMYEAPGMVAAL